MVVSSALATDVDNRLELIIIVVVSFSYRLWFFCDAGSKKAVVRFELMVVLSDEVGNWDWDSSVDLDDIAVVILSGIATDEDTEVLSGNVVLSSVASIFEVVIVENAIVFSATSVLSVVSVETVDKLSVFDMVSDVVLFVSSFIVPVEIVDISSATVMLSPDVLVVDAVIVVNVDELSFSFVVLCTIVCVAKVCMSDKGYMLVVKLEVNVGAFSASSVLFKVGLVSDVLRTFVDVSLKFVVVCCVSIVVTENRDVNAFSVVAVPLKVVSTFMSKVDGSVDELSITFVLSAVVWVDVVSVSVVLRISGVIFVDILFVVSILDVVNIECIEESSKTVVVSSLVVSISEKVLGIYVLNELFSDDGVYSFVVLSWIVVVLVSLVCNGWKVDVASVTVWFSRASFIFDVAICWCGDVGRLVTVFTAFIVDTGV